MTVTWVQELYDDTDNPRLRPLVATMARQKFLAQLRKADAADLLSFAEAWGYPFGKSIN